VHDGPSFLEWLGLRVPDLIAGFAGGVVNSFVFRRGEPVAVVGSVITGAFTANYLGEPAARILSLSEGAASFLVGVIAMALVQGAVSAAQNYRFNVPGPGGK
jgi:hypothetical protein